MANIANSGDVLETNAVLAAARPLGLEISQLKIRQAEKITPAMEGIKDRVESLYVAADALFNNNRDRINDVALGAGLPTMHGFRDIVAVGGLMSYAPDYLSLFRRAADYVDKILRGAKPADIPIEQPTKFELVINVKTAKALRLTLPPSGGQCTTTRQYARLVSEWIASIGLDPLKFGTHSLRRTKATLI